MAKDIEHVRVAKRFEKVVGKRQGDTWIYRRWGKRDDFRAWSDAVFEICAPDGAVSPGGVGMFVRVSREGVRRRFGAGRMTVFFFHMGRSKRPSYGFVPIVEVRRWAAVLDARRQG